MQHQTLEHSIIKHGQKPTDSNLVAYCIPSIKDLDACDSLPSNIARSSLVHSLVLSYMSLCSVKASFQYTTPIHATRDDLLRFHSVDYVDFLLHPEEDSEYTDSDCAYFPLIPTYVKYVAGASISAAKALTSGSSRIAINLDGGRHHAKSDCAAGFCYVNDIVLGILELHEMYQRVLYIDLDIHHGDGVEKAFEYTNKVFTLSFHRHDPGFYPGTGSWTSTGKGKGKYHSLNVPLRSGLKTATLIEILQAVIESIAKVYIPEAVVLMCGADGLAGDPLGPGREPGAVNTDGWNLDVTTFGKAFRIVDALNLPILILGGGGYNHPNVARAWSYLCLEVVCESGADWIWDIPEHDYFHMYGPDFRLDFGLGNRTDENIVTSATNGTRHIDWILEKTRNTINRISPS